MIQHIHTPYGERRHHVRFPILSHLVKQVTLTLAGPSERSEVPGVLGNLSAGGVALSTFVDVKPGTKVNLTLDLTGFPVARVEGEVVRTQKRDEAYLLGIMFTRIDRKLADVITRMGLDFDACELRWVREDKEICRKECCYHPLCVKEVKVKW